MKNKIILKAPKRYNKNLTGVVRLTPDAETVLQNLADETGLSLRTIASQMIIQGAKFVHIEEDC